VSNGGRAKILVIWGDDIGVGNLTCYSDGVMAAGFTVDQVMDKLLAGIVGR
jgi:arylsulfatase A-like enzyme